MSKLDRDALFVGLTRPQMLGGVTYSYFIVNGIITTEIFLLFKTPWVLLGALIVHGIGYIVCLNEPRFFDLWLVKASRCPRVGNHKIWRCNSYRA